MARETRKGWFRPKNAAKYLGDPTRIVYRSGWERRFMRYFDMKSSIVKWASEEFFIPYTSPVDGQRHRYFVDFYVETQTPQGIRKMIIEVKPKAQCKPPKLRTGRGTQKYLKEAATFAVNQAKWEAAREYAATRGWQFVVLTEDHLPNAD